MVWDNYLWNSIKKGENVMKKRKIIGLNISALDNEFFKTFAEKCITEGYRVFYIFSTEFIPIEFPLETVPKGASLITAKQLLKKCNPFDIKLYISSKHIEEKLEKLGFFPIFLEGDDIIKVQPNAIII